MRKKATGTQVYREGAYLPSPVVHTVPHAQSLAPTGEKELERKQLVFPPSGAYIAVHTERGIIIGYLNTAQSSHSMTEQEIMSDTIK